MWYIVYLATMRHSTSHETIEQIPEGQVPITGVARTVGLVAFSAAAGIGLDLWFTYRMHSIEVDAMARAIPAIGQVTMIAQRIGTQNTCHRITVAYRDQQGRPLLGGTNQGRTGFQRGWGETMRGRYKVAEFPLRLESSLTRNGQVASGPPAYRN